MTDLPDVESLRDRIGTEVAVSGWTEVTQDLVDRFANATGDRQWIHVDRERAARESPFGSTIAHGFLTLSLVTTLLHDALTIGGIRMALNYGLNRVRFITPLPVGSRIRGRFTPAALSEASDGGVQVAWTVTIERQDAEKPCCVVEWLVRYYPART